MRIFRFLPLLILCSSIIAAGVIVHYRGQQRQELVRRELLEVGALFDEQWRRHRLSELYVIRSDFDGMSRPLMTFEHKEDSYSVEEVHSLENEEQEYAVQKAQIRRFEEDRSVNALISDEIELCVGVAGVVYSVPVWADDSLSGIVSAMVPSDMVRRELGLGNLDRAVVLVSTSGQMFGLNDGSDELMMELGQSPDLAMLDGRTLLSSSVKMSSQSRWRLLLRQTHRDDLPAWSYWLDIFMPTSALLLGLAFSLMVARLHKNHLRQNQYVEQLLENQQIIKDTSRNLHLRVTELNFLYEVSGILSDPTVNESEAMRSVVDLIPLASRNSENTVARITVDGETYESKGFDEQPLKIGSGIPVEDETVGTIELFHRAGGEEDGEKPLGSQDQFLIDALARLVGSFIERRRAHEQIHQLA
ncbi:MAG: hypothetical protein ACE5FH_13015, partial [Candidatus Zixiibacteriota bacterium]